MATAEKQAVQTPAPEQAHSKGEVAIVSPPRLPYHPAISERFGIDRASWKALVEAVYPEAKTTDSVILALSYCKARKLDPFKRVVHIVPVWDSERRAYVETVWPGIAEHRTTAFRTKQYAGADACQFGETIEQAFSGETKRGKINVTLKFPAWAQLTVYRLIDGQRVPVPGPRVYWLETYSRLGRAEVPNDMWQKRPFGQLEKCAEAAALRRAFPEELGDEPTVEEAGAFQGPEQAKDVTPPAAPPKRADFAENGASAAPARDMDREYRASQGQIDTDPPEDADEPAPDADSPAAKDAANGAAGADNASAGPERKPVPHIAVPAADASVKAWGNYRGQLIETIKTAPDAAWLAEFQERNQDGISVLDSEFPPAAKMVREAIQETLAAFGRTAAA